MAITHRHLQTGVTQYLLQDQACTLKPAAVHHEERCEGMPENMGHLPFRELYP